ncbi:unnamed protein product [Prunus brigantina]
MTSSTIDKLNSKHHLINDRNANADRHQDILSLALSTAVLTSVTRVQCLLSL